MIERIELDVIVDTYMAEYHEAKKKLEPLNWEKSAEIILAEVGLSMEQFPSSGHLSS